MITKDELNRHVRQTVLLTVALLAALIFGIVVLARGDWIPGTLIVATSLIGLARQIPMIVKRRAQTPPAPPRRSEPMILPRRAGLYAEMSTHGRLTSCGN